MQRLKRILLPMQGKEKSQLHWLYNTVGDIEEEKIFHSGSLDFRFEGSSRRTPEKLFLRIEFAAPFPVAEQDMVLYENYLLHVLAPAVNELGRSYVNENKDSREKAQFAAQTADARVLRRNGLCYDAAKERFVFRVHFQVPLVNALSVNAKAVLRAIRDILLRTEEALRTLDMRELEQCLITFRRQREIRSYLRENGVCVFIADGSILPREAGTEAPKSGALPFVSPPGMQVTIPFSDGGELSGMAIRQGVTVITGGGYSGKSTLLDAIERGVYDYLPGDGREYVITEKRALKIYAEDGRPVSELDLRPFFRFLPGDSAVGSFSTGHASGSVSQAANIVEALCGGSRLLLIDEDKSATNFMIRDRNMRRIVSRDPIIPFTDRVRELAEEQGVSCILVIGGSSEYLACADTILLMEEYMAKEITAEVRALDLPSAGEKEPSAQWPKSRRILPEETGQPFLYFGTVETENEKKIILDGYSADITHLTALVSGEQMNTLSYLMEQLLTDRNADSAELIEKAEALVENMHAAQMEAKSLLPELSWRFYEAIRPIDVFCCANRMRGVGFVK